MKASGAKWIGILLSAALWSCQQQSTVSTTRGSATVACDESLFPVIQFQAGDFHNTYPEASIAVVSLEAREAVVSFMSDSIRTIVLGREFNKEELEYIKGTKIDYEGYKIAYDAVVVVTHLQNQDTTMRISELDSIYSGMKTRWTKGKRQFIDAFVGGINSSADEVFKAKILKGGAFGPTITRIKSSDHLIEQVKTNPNAIGIVGVSWMPGREEHVRKVRLGGGTYQPDSTVVPGQFFSPAQAHILHKYYPISRDVYVYTREVRRDASYGFIAYMKDRKGQQNFINHGLAPATMPVRIVGDLTSQKVHEQ